MLHFLTLGCTVSVLQIHRSLLNSKGSSGAETTPASARGCPAPSAPHPCGAQPDTRGSGLVSPASSTALLPARIGAGRRQSVLAAWTQATTSEKLNLDPRGWREPFCHHPEVEFWQKGALLLASCSCDRVLPALGGHLDSRAVEAEPELPTSSAAAANPECKTYFAKKCNTVLPALGRSRELLSGHRVQQQPFKPDKLLSCYS